MKTLLTLRQAYPLMAHLCKQAKNQLFGRTSNEALEIIFPFSNA
jgi:hypothetical protein